MTDHSRPPDAPDGLVEAMGKLFEALERLDRARGALYTFHQLIGGVDASLDEVIDGLRDNGHPALADRVRTELVGRDVLPGRWTFEVVEGFEDGYYQPFRELEEVRTKTTDGRRHVFEAELKRSRQIGGTLTSAPVSA
jgi:hypothetical protein